jgi:drug/metabolite transporter (DMT)-like permease
MDQFLLKAYGILLVGVICFSSSAIMVRFAFATAGGGGLVLSLWLAFLRLGFATALILPLQWVVQQRQTLGKTVSASQLTVKAVALAIAAGVCLGLHFASWITSLSFTSVAASTTLVTTTPLWLVLVSWIGWRERPGRLTLIGIAIALTGGLAIAGGDVTGEPIGSQPLLGNGLALMGAWTVSAYLLLGQAAQAQGLSLGQYSLIAYGTATLGLLPILVWGRQPILQYPPAILGYGLLMALIPQLIGHTSLNWSVRHLSPTLVSLWVLTEPLAASGFAWIFFQEVPSFSVLTGGGLVLVGVACSIIGQSSQK